MNWDLIAALIREGAVNETMTLDYAINLLRQQVKVEVENARRELMAALAEERYYRKIRREHF